MARVFPAVGEPAAESIATTAPNTKKPVTVNAALSHAAFGPDGDYFTKPSREDVVRAVYGVVRERSPHRFAAIFGDQA